MPADERRGLHHGVKMSPLVWCEDSVWLAHCPPLLNQEVCIPNTCQPHPFPGNPHQLSSVAKHTSERGWHIIPGREGRWGKRGRQWCLAMALWRWREVCVTGWSPCPQRAELCWQPVPLTAGQGWARCHRRAAQGLAQSCRGTIS